MGRTQEWPWPLPPSPQAARCRSRRVSLCEQLANTAFKDQAALHVRRVYPRDYDTPTVPGPRPRPAPPRLAALRLLALG